MGKQLVKALAAVSSMTKLRQASDLNCRSQTINETKTNYAKHARTGQNNQRKKPERGKITREKTVNPDV